MTAWQSPWRSNGSLLSYPAGVQLWRPADYTWWEALKLDYVLRGRSSTQFIWRGVDKNMMSDRYYPMFPVDMKDLLMTSYVVNGYVRYQWKVVKRGSNYGIARADIAAL